MKGFLSALMCLSLASSAYADLVVHISQGVEKPYPIAIVPFSQTPTTNNVVPKGMLAVVKNDLYQTGQFDLIPGNKISSHPIPVGEFPFKAWLGKQMPSDYVLIGQTKPGEKPHSENISFQLINTYTRHPLMAMKYNSVPDKQLRQLAHEIANRVYRSVTGVKGDFGSRVAYVLVNNPQSRKGKYRLVVSDSDGFNPQTLLYQVGNPIASPTWSSDRKRIAYVSYTNNRMGIYEIQLSTGQRKLIANYPGINSAPAYSPDDRYMAMALSLGKGAQTDIYQLNLATHKLRRLTSLGTNTSPQYSSDGKTIIFTSNRGGNPQVYQLDVASKKVSRLSFDGVQNFEPRYLPDQSGIIMMHQGMRGGPIRIAKLDPSSGATRVITQGQLDKSPSVSPNGRMIIYANYDEPKGVLAETSLNGRVKLVLPSTKGSVQSPAWG